MFWVHRYSMVQFVPEGYWSIHVILLDSMAKDWDRMSWAWDVSGSIRHALNTIRISDSKYGKSCIAVPKRLNTKVNLDNKWRYGTTTQERWKLVISQRSNAKMQRDYESIQGMSQFKQMIRRMKPHELSWAIYFELVNPCNEAWGR